MLIKTQQRLAFSSKFSSVKWDYWQTLLSRAGEELTPMMIEVYKNGGKNGAYKSALKNLKIDISKAINGFDFNDTLPWDFIENYPPKNLLINEYKRLKKRSNNE